MGRFDDITASPSQTGRFDNIGTVKGRFDDLKVGEPEKGILSKVGSKIGGAFGTLGKILSTGQRAVTGAAEFGLEKTGILKDTGASPIKSIKNEASNIDLLKRVGEERGGGVLTGQYKPTQSVFGNFVKELPVTTIGTLADVFADPLFVLGKVGQIAKGTKKIGEAIKVGATKVADEIPAVQKVGDMLGRAFVTRYGQGEAFKNLDIGRKIEESLAQEKVGKLVADVIEKPQFIQKRITQIIRGEIDNIPEEFVKAQTPLFRGGFGNRTPDTYWLTSTEKNAVRFGRDAKAGSKGIEYIPDVTKMTDEGIQVERFGVKEGAKLFDTRNTTLPKELLDKLGYKIEDNILKGVVPGSDRNVINNYLKNNGYEGSVWEHSGGNVHTAVFSKDSLLTKSQLTDIWNKAQGATKGIDITNDELKILAQPIREELDRVGKAISDINPKLLSEETFLANKGTYFPRLYSDKEFANIDDVVEKAFGSRAVSIPKEGFMKRTLTEAQSLEKGTRIEEAGFPALKRLTQLNIVEKRQEFFSEVAKLASKEAQPGFIQLSSDKSLGDLAGKFLPVAEYNAIAQMRRVPTQLEEIYGKGLSLWKTFKTAYNPSTITRNDLTNYFILNPLGGVGPHRLDIYARWANEMKTKGPLYQMARKEGLEISTQQAAELTQQATRFYRANEGVTKQFFNKVGDFHEAVKNFYGSQDKFFKGANFLKGVTEDGLTPTQAMRRANFYLIDYSEVPEFIQWLRKSPIGIPFISFTYGVSKPLARTLLERPDKLSAYYKILNGIQSMNPLGETPQELQREEDVLPDWISSGTYLRLPVKDKIGRSQYVDLQYILPTNVLEASNLVPSSPVFSWTAALMTNKDPYFQKEIWSENDKPEEKAKKGATYLLKQFFPSLTPFIGSSYQKISNAIQKRPDRSGFVKGNIQMIIDVLGGIRVTPIDPTIEGQKRASEKQKEVRDLQTQLRLIMLDKSLFPEEKERQAGEVREELQTVFSE